MDQRFYKIYDELYRFPEGDFPRGNLIYWWRSWVSPLSLDPDWLRNNIDKAEQESNRKLRPDAKTFC